MAKMSRVAAHPPAEPGAVKRPHHFSARRAGSYAIALDVSGRLHFDRADIGGDHMVVLLGCDVTRHGRRRHVPGNHSG